MIFLAAHMALIFSLSAQNAEISSETSGGIIEWLAGIFYPGFSDLAAARQEEIIASFQFIARKAAHFSLYAVLGFWSLLSVAAYRNLYFKLRIAISAGICLLYAASDEFHQLFVSGRSGEIRDVLIDFSGALIGIAVTALLVRIIKPIYKRIRTVESNEE